MTFVRERQREILNSLWIQKCLLIIPALNRLRQKSHKISSSLDYAESSGQSKLLIKTLSTPHPHPHPPYRVLVFGKRKDGLPRISLPNSSECKADPNQYSPFYLCWNPIEVSQGDSWNDNNTKSCNPVTQCLFHEYLAMCCGWTWTVWGVTAQMAIFFFFPLHHFTDRRFILA